MKFVSVLMICVSISMGDGQRSRIYGGELSPEVIPYLVSVQYKVLLAATHICGGGIISKRWVLTAAQCITRMQSLVKTFEILAGVINLQSEKPHPQRIPVAQYHVHPGFTGGASQNDIALLKLSNPLFFNDAVQALLLPVSTSIPLNGNAIISGWGSSSEGLIPNFSTKLRTVSVPIISIEECANALMNSSVTPTYTHVCTGPSRGVRGHCVFDEGGPLVQGEGRNAMILGIASYREYPCGSSPSVYTRVSAFKSFIKEHTIGDL